MNKEFLFDEELFDEKFDDEINELDEQDIYLRNIDFCLTEIDFYPPSDNRVLASDVEDIDGGDNFIDYCEEFFEMLDEEEYYDD